MYINLETTVIIPVQDGENEVCWKGKVDLGDFLLSLSLCHSPEKLHLRYSGSFVYTLRTAAQDHHDATLFAILPTWTKTKSW